VVIASINIGFAIITEAALSFLGIGVPPVKIGTAFYDPGRRPRPSPAPAGARFSHRRAAGPVRPAAVAVPRGRRRSGRDTPRRPAAARRRARLSVNRLRALAAVEQGGPDLGPVRPEIPRELSDGHSVYPRGTLVLENSP